MEDLLTRLTPPPFSVRKIYALLPAYNEVDALSILIPNIVQNLKKIHRTFEIIVVNDGSTDTTSQFLSRLPSEFAIRELRHERNRGYGAALKTGFLWAAQNARENDVVVTLDADNTQDPVYISSFLTKLEEGFDVVTASYTMPGGQTSGIPFLRRLMSAFVNQLFHWVIGISQVRTYTNGFRAYRVSAIQKANRRYADDLIQESGFPGGTEFFLKVIGTGSKAAEIPFSLHYEHRGSGSKIRLLSTIGRYMKLLVTGGSYSA